MSLLLCPLEPENLVSPLILRKMRNFLRSSRHLGAQTSAVSLDQDAFQAKLDVQQFTPEEITVKVLENVVTVEGKHEEKEDEHGYISRHFVRKYVLPKGHDANRVESRLSSDGVLTITAPKLQTGKKRQRDIPIIQTGQPSEAVEDESKRRKKA